MKLSYKYLTLNVSPACLLRLKGRMRWVRAAGGIVTDAEGRMLLIRRNGRWDLPKGKVEAGETLLQAALREVEEETGIKAESGQCAVCSVQCAVSSGQCSVGSGQCVVDSTGSSATHYPLPTTHSITHSPLPTTHYPLNHPLPTKTYHVFNLYGGWHLKQTSWFAMTADGRQGVPQQEEGITEVVWVTPDEWYRRLQHSYGTLRTLSRQWIKSVR